MSSPRVALPGSDRHELRPHVPHPRCHPFERHEVTVKIKAGSETYHSDAMSVGAHLYNDCGLTLVSASEVERSMHFAGTTSQLEKAFGVVLEHRDTPEGTYCAHFGPVTIPAELANVVEGVFGLDQRPVAKPHYRRMPKLARHKAYARAHNQVMESAKNEQGGYNYSEGIGRLATEAGERAFKQPPGTFLPTQVAELYNFPPGDGHGETIAIIELGGGYRTSDLKTYFSEIGVSLPSVSTVSVNHGRNAPGSDADGEVMLDIEVAGAIAPKASIVVYFTPNTSQGFMDAISTAIHDSHHKPSVISISWGGPESGWSKADMTSMDNVLSEAAALGITVLVASGDNGSSDGEAGNNVDFPASSPHVTGTGGTKLTVDNGTITEVVWNDGSDGAGGGGFSTSFPVPAYQDGHVPAGSSGRGVPDISGDADPSTGWAVRVDSSDTIIGGTSAVSPAFAGLVARLNQITGKRAGFLNPILYSHPEVCRDITSGNNGAYSAEPGWDAASGLGVIDGEKLLEALS